MASDATMRLLELLTEKLAAVWVDAEVAADRASVPDFWYDLGTSERLAAWLVERGWRKG